MSTDYKALRKAAGDAAKAIGYILKSCKTASDPSADLRARLAVTARCLLRAAEDEPKHPNVTMDERSVLG